MVKKPIDWAAMSPLWDFFENMGLAPQNILQIEDYLMSPIAFMGSGVGIVYEYLLNKGFNVTAVDSCKEMVDLAKKKRGLETFLSDVRKTRFPSFSFNSVLLSTGVVNGQNIYQPYIDELLTESRRILEADGNLLISYFPEDSDSEYYSDVLSLNVVPSNNVMFIGSKNLDDVRRRFTSYNHIPKQLINQIFERYGTKLTEHLLFVNKISQYLIENKIDPEKFISQRMGYKTYDLTPDDAKYLLKKTNQYFPKVKMIDIGNQTEVIIARR